MAFVQSAKEVHLRDHHILVAEVKNEHGHWERSELDLNKHIGNSDGFFTWDGHNFSESAKDIRLEGTKLTAQLTKRDGGHRERQGIELNDRITNKNGHLTFV